MTRTVGGSTCENIQKSETVEVEELSDDEKVNWLKKILQDRTSVTSYEIASCKLCTTVSKISIMQSNYSWNS